MKNNNNNKLRYGTVEPFLRLNPITLFNLNLNFNASLSIMNTSQISYTDEVRSNEVRDGKLKALGVEKRTNKRNPHMILESAK